MTSTRPRSILITGCSTGIGHACAHGLRRRGWRVFASARKSADVQRLREEGLESLLLDVDSPGSIREAVGTVLEATNGGLDALFNNAGYGQPGALEDISREALRAQFETNLFGAHELCTLVLPAMRRQGHGRIVFNSSVLGFAALPYRGPYNASKFAMEGLADTLRMELAGSGITVSLIEPGPISSAFRANAYRHYQAHVDAAASAHRNQYQAMDRRLTAPDSVPGFTLTPDAVLTRLIHALEHARPKPRYYVTVPTHVFGYLRRLLSTRAMDRILLRSTRSERE
ncbi:MAG: SDR family NAD(P)-dependent oxidoreductase [Ectothiorhodospiraceae bacterium]|nr:SDR family NAD(P)-dependent oxidoreductase [Ectothiorhodospiraceae bacterium]